MATKADRGTKRTCQDASCAVRFYDLARDPIKCPSCGALYQIVASPPVAERRPTKRPAFVPVAPEPAAEDALLQEASADVALDDPGDDVLPEEDDDDTNPADFAGEPEKEDR